MAEFDELFGEKFQRELGEVAVELERVQDLADGVSRTLTRAFRGAISDGKSLNGVLSDIARRFADIALEAALKPVGLALSGLVEGIFSATNPVLQGITPFARGGVVNGPAFFPMAAGVGLAGEAGPEAILPLQRGSDGRLGVAGQGGNVTINLSVQATDLRSFRGAEAEMSAMLLRAVQRGRRGS